MTTTRITPEEYAAKSKEQQAGFKEIWQSKTPDADWKDAEQMVYETFDTYDRWTRSLQPNVKHRQMYEPAEESVEEAGLKEYPVKYIELEEDGEIIIIDINEGPRCVWIAGHAFATATLQSQLNEAKAEVAALKEAQRWVPVLERLPEVETPLYCCTMFGKPVIAKLKYDKLWEVQGSEMPKEFDYITHYKPLDLPPATNQR